MPKARDEVLQLVDSELQQLREDSTAPGWTNWALLGAAATCFWLLLDQVAQRGPNWRNVALVLVFVLMARIGVVLPFKLLSPQTPDPRKGRLILAKDLLGTRRNRLLLDACTFALAYYVFSHVHLGATSHPKTLLLVCGFYFVVLILAYLLSLSGIPVPTTEGLLPIRPRRSSEWIGTIGSVVFIGAPMIGTEYVACGLAHDLFNAGLSVHDIRIASLVLGLFGTCSLAARSHGEPALLSNLVEIRRSMVLKGLPVEIARDQLSLALLGLRISDYLAKRVRRTLSSLQIVDEVVESAEKEVHALAKLEFDESRSEPDTLVRSALIQAVLRKLEAAGRRMCFDVLPELRILKRYTVALSRFLAEDSSGRMVLGQLDASVNSRIMRYNDLFLRLHQDVFRKEGADVAANLTRSVNAVAAQIDFDPSSGRPRR